MKLVLGSRGSKLALVQTGEVAAYLRNAGARIEIKTIITSGDRIKTSLAAAGGKGLFVKELEEALLAGEIDIAVHSMKDVPGVLPKGLQLAATPGREDPRDVVISCSGQQLSQLPRGARVGTSSPRRKMQLLALRLDLKVVPMRGNIDTRLKKLRAGEVDAILLAAAGLKRLGMEPEITEYLETDRMIPAIGQGALALEVRKDAKELQSWLCEELNDEASDMAIAAERALLAAVGGDCYTPVAAYAAVKDDHLTLRAFLATPDGVRSTYATTSGSAQDASQLGGGLGLKLLQGLR